MRKELDTTEVTEGGDGFSIIPEGDYVMGIVEIKESLTANFDEMATIKLVVITGEYAGQWIWDNIVMSNNLESPGYKILGRTKHFLHCIGEPYEGKFTADTDKWISKNIRVQIYHNMFINQEGHKIIRAKVKNYLLEE